MTSTEEVEKAVQAACDAAARNDASKVMMCLHSRPIAIPAGLDEPLLPMSSFARHLLENMNDGPFHPEHSLRALMSVPCCYETPWRAALHMIQAFHSRTGNLGKQSGKVLWTCVTDVQTFLQLTVEAWWKQERQRTASTRPSQSTHKFSTTDVSPRHLLMKLADTLLRPLDNDDLPESVDNQHWTQPLELVTTIVSLCQDLQPCGKKTLSDHVLNRLFHSSVRPDRLLPWLTLASDIRSHLRSNDWTRLYDILQDSITNNTKLIPPSDLPGLVRGIVTFLVKRQDEQQAWDLLVLHLLHSASLDDATTYSTVEAVLKSSLASLQNPTLARLIKALKNDVNAATDNVVPKWIRANMNLMLLQAVQQSGSQLVSGLVSRALGKDTIDGGIDLQQKCWEALKQLAFPALQESTHDRRRNRKPQDMIQVIKTTLNEVYYEGNGQFRRDGDGTEECNLSSELVCQSIFLGKTRPSKRSHHVFVSERAQLWVHAAYTILRPSFAIESGPQTNLDVLFAILIIVTIYCEVPASRSTVVRTSMQSLSGKENCTVSDDVPACLCAMVATIVRSMTRDSHLDDGIQELYPLSGIFGESLSKEVFCDLTTALSALPCARSALLSISRKYSQSSFGGNLWWGMGTASRGMQENRDRVDCALQGLCALLATASQQSWDDCGIDSWIILSDIIVQNKPALRMSERSALFHRIASFIKKQKFSIDTIEHLLRACLVRLLQFFDGDTEDTLELIPERIFVGWGPRDASSDGGTSISQREDIAGLLRLIMLLLDYQRKLCNDDAGKDGLCRGRARVLRLFSNERKVDEGLGTIIESRERLYSQIACDCIAGALRSVMSSCAPTQSAEGRRTMNVDIRVTESWREYLISTEIERCKGYGMTSDPKQRLAWLKRSSFDNEVTAVRQLTACDRSTKHRLFSSLCDIILELVFHPFWSKSAEKDRNEQRQEMLDCSLSLIGLKRELSRHCDGGIYVKESDLTELTFDSITLSSSAVPFLGLCSDFINASRFEGVSLDKAEDLIVSLLLFCAALKRRAYLEEESGKSLDVPKRLEITRQLWSLYRAIGDEDSAQHLVSYLEEQGVNQLENAHNETATSRSFLTIKTDGDVDEIVQRVRLSVLSTMSDWLQSFADPCEELSGTGCVGTSQFHSFKVDGSLSTSFWLQSLRSFASDLKAGLDGHSGGITEDLYSTYLSLIERSCKCVSLMLPQEADARLVRRASQAALECASILEDILCDFPLKGAPQFKKTMMLSTSELPSMQRQATLMLVASGKDLPTSTGKVIDFFYQMMHVTERQYFKLESTTWSEIAGTAHVNATVDAESSDDESMNRICKSQRDSSADENSSVPSMIVIPGNDIHQGGNLDSTATKKDKKVQLPSKESWQWASCCSLAAMEQLWMESLSILNGNSTCSLQSTSISAASWRKYCLEHAKLLSDVIKATCFAMKSFKELKDGRRSENFSKENATTILATTFTDAVKVRFCMLLDKISAALQVALRSIATQIKKGRDIEDSMRTESMACISSWLTVEPEELGLESLSKRWYEAEKQLSETDAGIGGVHKRLSVALRRLPKFLVRTQELETDLRKLYQLLGKVEQEGTPRGRNVLEQYESLLNTHGSEEDAPTSLQSMIKTKLKFLGKSGISSDFFGAHLVGSSTMNANESGVTRKRLRKALTRKERRRNVKRSRNQIVDQWLHLDDEYEDEGIEDAYVDLEDFIVDG